MKRFINILLFAVVSMTTFSQSRNDLDMNPSFKGITIGAPISKYSDILKFKGTYKGKSSYSVIDQQYYSIFNVKMDDMVVVENEGKVWGVLLSKTYTSGIFNPKELEVLKSGLTSKYGTPNVDLTDFSETPSVAGVRWQTNKIVLDIAYLFYGTGEDGSGLRYILYQRNDDY